MRVVVADAIAPEGVAYLREHGCHVDDLVGAPPDALRGALAEADGLVTRSSTAVTKPGCPRRVSIDSLRPTCMAAARLPAAAVAQIQLRMAAAASGRTCSREATWPSSLQERSN